MGASARRACVAADEAILADDECDTLEDVANDFLDLFGRSVDELADARQNIVEKTLGRSEIEPRALNHTERLERRHRRHPECRTCRVVRAHLMAEELIQVIDGPGSRRPHLSLETENFRLVSDLRR